MHALVHAADVQDRDGGVWVMATLFGLYPFLTKLYADGGYNARGFQAGVKRAMAKLSDIAGAPHVEVQAFMHRRCYRGGARHDGALRFSVATVAPPASAESQFTRPSKQ